MMWIPGFHLCSVNVMHMVQIYYSGHLRYVPALAADHDHEPHKEACVGVFELWVSLLINYESVCIIMFQKMTP